MIHYLTQNGRSTSSLSNDDNTSTVNCFAQKLFAPDSYKCLLSLLTQINVKAEKVSKQATGKQG